MALDLRLQGLVPPGGTRDHNLEHLSFFFYLFIFIDSFIFEQKILLRDDFLSVTSEH